MWDTATDTLTPGSWFAGELYPLKSDLSPDGKHLVYYARNESKNRLERARAEWGVDHFWTWTAVCKPPWVKALGLWEGGLPGDGGGVFCDSRTLWLNYYVQSLAQVKTLRQPPGLATALYPERGHRPIWTAAMKRTGWHLLQTPEAGDGYPFASQFLLQKQELELRIPGRERQQFTDEYRWHGPNPPDLSGVTWADLDQQGRLVYARAGRIYAQGAQGEREVFNLNTHRPPMPWRTS